MESGEGRLCFSPVLGPGALRFPLKKLCKFWCILTAITPDCLKSKSSETRTLWAQVPAIHLLDGILVHKFSDKCLIQLVVPTTVRQKLFELTYAGPLAAHLNWTNN